MVDPRTFRSSRSFDQNFRVGSDLEAGSFTPRVLHALIVRIRFHVSFCYRLSVIFNTILDLILFMFFYSKYVFPRCRRVYWSSVSLQSDLNLKKKMLE